MDKDINAYIHILNEHLEYQELTLKYNPIEFNSNDILCFLRNNLSVLRNEIMKCPEYQSFYWRVASIIADFHEQWLNTIEITNTCKNYAENISITELEKYIDRSVSYDNYRHAYFISMIEKKFGNVDNQNIHIKIEECHDNNQTIVNGLEKKKTQLAMLHKDMLKNAVFSEININAEWIKQVFETATTKIGLVLLNSVPSLISSVKDNITNISKNLRQIKTKEQYSLRELHENLNSERQNCNALCRQSSVCFNELNQTKESINTVKDLMPIFQGGQQTPFIDVMSFNKKYLENRLAELEMVEEKLKYLKSVRHKFEFEYQKIHTQYINRRTGIDESDIEEPHKDSRKHDLNLKWEVIISYLWDIERKIAAMENRLQKSLLCILNLPGDLHEQFTEGNKRYYINEYGNKIYKKLFKYEHITDEEMKALLTPPDCTASWFEESGKYKYINEQRVYQRASNASLHDLDSQGHFYKMSTTVDNRKYHYNDFGKYYVDEQDREIYVTDNDGQAIILSGMGKRVQPQTPINSNVEAVLTTEESSYLKRVVGPGLTRAIAALYEHKPSDPIHYLGHKLWSYRFSLKTKVRDDDNKIAVREEIDRMLKFKQEMETIHKDYEALHTVKVPKGDSDPVLLDDFDYFYTFC